MDPVTNNVNDGAEHLGHRLTAYLFGDLNDAGRKFVEAHLETCAACRAERDELQATLGALEEALAPNAGEGGGEGAAPGAGLAMDPLRLERVLLAGKSGWTGRLGEELSSRFVGRIGGWKAKLLASAAAVMLTLSVGFLVIMRSKGSRDWGAAPGSSVARAQYERATGAGGGGGAGSGSTTTDAWKASAGGATAAPVSKPRGVDLPIGAPVVSVEVHESADPDQYFNAPPAEPAAPALYDEEIQTKSDSLAGYAYTPDGAAAGGESGSSLGDYGGVPKQQGGPGGIPITGRAYVPNGPARGAKAGELANGRRNGLNVPEPATVAPPAGATAASPDKPSTRADAPYPRPEPSPKPTAPSRSRVPQSPPATEPPPPPPADAVAALKGSLEGRKTVAHLRLAQEQLAGGKANEDAQLAYEQALEVARRAHAEQERHSSEDQTAAAKKQEELGIRYRQLAEKAKLGKELEATRGLSAEVVGTAFPTSGDRAGADAEGQGALGRLSTAQGLSVERELNGKYATDERTERLAGKDANRDGALDGELDDAGRDFRGLGGLYEKVDAFGSKDELKEFNKRLIDAGVTLADVAGDDAKNAEATVLKVEGGTGLKIELDPGATLGPRFSTFSGTPMAGMSVGDADFDGRAELVTVPSHGIHTFTLTSPNVPKITAQTQDGTFLGTLVVTGIDVSGRSLIDASIVDSNGAPVTAGDRITLLIPETPGEGQGQGQGQGGAPVPAAVERRLRAFEHYRKLDAALTWEAFLARGLDVPPPAIGDEGLGSERFKDRYGVNPFVDTLRDHFSTFAMDVDTASYTRARSLLREQRLPETSTVRVEEFVNYFQEAHPADPERAFSVFADGGPAPFGAPGTQLLKVTVKARELAPGERRPAVLTFCVDTSGSMFLEQRLEVVRHALSRLLSALAPDDRVAVVAYGQQPYLALPHTPARDASRILGAVSSLAPGGGTNVEAGLDLAYRLADEAFHAKASNRVILCSDGVATDGARGADEVLEKVKVFARRGIDLTVVGVGRERYDDAFLEKLADNGNGSYAYVDTAEEAERLFVTCLPANLEVLAYDAKIQVDFDPSTVSHYRLLGYENRDIKDEDFRNDTVDAGEVGPGKTVTALYEIARREGAHGALGRVFVRFRGATSGVVEELDFPLPPGVLATDRGTCSDRFGFIASVAELAELLRDSYWARDGSYAALIAHLDALGEETRATPEWAEVRELAARAQVLVCERASAGR